MRMQESQFLLEEGADQLRLSGLASEWLFSSGFWSNFNAAHGTMFDQYEEDVADVPVVKDVIVALEEIVRDMRLMDGLDVEFVYGWTAEPKPLKASIPRERLLLELMMLRDFLTNAAAKNLPVTFSL